VTQTPLRGSKGERSRSSGRFGWLFTGVRRGGYGLEVGRSVRTAGGAGAYCVATPTACSFLKHDRTITKIISSVKPELFAHRQKQHAYNLIGFLILIGFHSSYCFDNFSV